MTKNFRLVTVAITLLVLAFGAFASNAQTIIEEIPPAPYIQINHSNISVTDTETPDIVVQFGNQTQQTFEDITVVCAWQGNIRAIADDTGFVTQNGPLEEPTFFPPAGENPPAFLWNGSVDLQPGQNFNLSFGIRFVETAPDGAEILACAVVEAQDNVQILSDLTVLAVSETVPVEIRRTTGQAGPIEEQNTDGLHIQLNHGNISVTDAETPNIVAQFGNHGSQPISGVGVICGWSGNIRAIADDTGFVSDNGPFGEPTLITPPNTVGTPFEGLAIFLWDGRVDLSVGQNFNVSFGIRFVDAAPDGSEALRCFAVIGEGDLTDLTVVAESNIVPVEIRR